MLFKTVLTGVLIVALLSGITGCAEGPLWRTGYLSPRVRQQWQEEEQIAATIFSRREEMQKQVDQALASDSTAQQQIASQLGEIVASDPVVLMKIEATRLLGDLPVSTACDGLQVAARDRDVSVRIAAVRALGNRTDDSSMQILANMSRSDDNLDVRIAATSELGNFKGEVPMLALGEALSHTNPAMQLSAARALQRMTGKDLGNDIVAWQQFVENHHSVSETDNSITRQIEAGNFRR